MRSTLVSAPFVHAAVGWSNVWRSIRSSWTASFSSVASLWKFFLLELSLADSDAEDPSYNCDLFYFSPASLLAFPSYIHFFTCVCMMCMHVRMCSHMEMHVYWDTHAHVWEQTGRPEVDTEHLPWLLPTLYVEGLSLNLEPTNYGWAG